MKILIGIATFERPQKLLRVLCSLLQQTHVDFDVYIAFDNNDKSGCEPVDQWIIENNPHFQINYTIMDKQGFVIRCWNMICHDHMMPQLEYDGFMGLVDDVELTPSALVNAVATLSKYYPDTDGVIGLKQECPGHPNYTFKWFGQTLMGRKWIDRYKSVDHQICCPQYRHFFQDEEMYEYASSLDKFIKCENALLYHYHPAFAKNECDATHFIVRSNGKFNLDVEINRLRKLKGYVWGRNFNVI